MIKETFSEYIVLLNKKAKDFKIGELQDYRNRWKNKKNNFPLFKLSDQQKEEEWAKHFGGSEETQFNTSFEPKDRIRYGIALSIKTTQSIRDLEPLQKRFKILNEIIKNNEFDFSDYMIHRWHHDQKSKNKKVTIIPNDWAENGNFIFIGKINDKKVLDINDILNTYDDLFPLYLMIEERARTQKDLLVSVEKGASFNDSKRIRVDFKNGKKPQKSYKYSQTERIVNADVRHTIIQKATYDLLNENFGDIVKIECPIGRKSIDLVVDFGDNYEFYEIKTSSTALGCIREAFGQIMEYAFYYEHDKPISMVIVGEPECDKATDKYIRKLNKGVNLPIRYMSIKC